MNVKHNEHNYTSGEVRIWLPMFNTALDQSIAIDAMQAVQEG